MAVYLNQCDLHLAFVKLLLTVVTMISTYIHTESLSRMENVVLQNTEKKRKETLGDRQGMWKGWNVIEIGGRVTE